MSTFGFEGGSHHGGLRDWPVIFVGGCSKKMKLGRYLHFPSYQNAGRKSIANVYMSILEAAGVIQDGYFGQMDTQLKDLDIKGPISELLT